MKRETAIEIAVIAGAIHLALARDEAVLTGDAERDARAALPARRKAEAENPFRWPVLVGAPVPAEPGAVAAAMFAMVEANAALPAEALYRQACAMQRLRAQRWRSLDRPLRHAFESFAGVAAMMAKAIDKPAPPAPAPATRDFERLGAKDEADRKAAAGGKGKGMARKVGARTAAKTGQTGAGARARG